MIERDTIRLLRECDAGVKMGVSSLAGVLGNVKDEKLRAYLEKALEDNTSMQKEVQTQLEAYHDEGKDPALTARGMSWLKTNMKLSTDGSDAAIAELITDGCNMGVKSLSRYLNQYGAADEKSKKLCTKLIGFEAQLEKNLREFL